MLAHGQHTERLPDHGRRVVQTRQANPSVEEQIAAINAATAAMHDRIKGLKRETIARVRASGRGGGGCEKFAGMLMRVLAHTRAVLRAFV